MVLWNKKPKRRRTGPLLCRSSGIVM